MTMKAGTRVWLTTLAWDFSPGPNESGKVVRSKWSVPDGYVPVRRDGSKTTMLAPISQIIVRNH